MQIENVPLIRHLETIDDFEEWKAALTGAMDSRWGRSLWLYNGDRLRAAGYEVTQWVDMTREEQDLAVEALRDIPVETPKTVATAVPTRSRVSQWPLVVGILVFGGGAVLTLFGVIAWIVFRLAGG